MASTSYMRSLPVTEFRRYESKLVSVGLKTCPFMIPESEWANDPTEWPGVGYADIYSYLVESPGIYTRHTMKNYRSLEAHNYFTSGWVKPIFHYKPNGSTHLICRAKVMPSWRVTEVCHNAWVAVGSDGTVSAAHCDCMAGLGETCSHVAAVLFKIEASVRLGVTTLACTSTACEWNNVYVRNVEGAQIKDIMFFTKEAKDKVKEPKEKVKEPTPLPEPATQEEQNFFLGLLAKTGEKPILLSTFGQFAKDFTTPAAPPRNSLLSLPPTLRSLYGNDSETAHCLEVTEEQVALVEESTLDQAVCDTWHQQRAGRITGSTAHAVLHTNPERPANSVIMKVCKPATGPVRSVPVQWGRQHEGHGLQTYSYTQGLSEQTEGTSSTVFVSEEVRGHVNMVLKKAGFRICREQPYLGVSCDGYVSCDCCGTGVLEIKCPYNWGQNASMTVEDWVKDPKGHLSSITALKTTHPYYTQTQLQMYVCQTTYGDFITWTPYRAVILRVKRDEAFLRTEVERLSQFWGRHIYPELRTLRRERAAKGKDKDNAE